MLEFLQNNILKVSILIFFLLAYTVNIAVFKYLEHQVKGDTNISKLVDTHNAAVKFHRISVIILAVFLVAYGYIVVA